MDAPSPSPVRTAAELREWFRPGGRTLVALSGGVDSAVVAAIARAALGDDAVAVTLTGPAVGAEEIAQARAAARESGIRHALVAVDPLAVEGYRTNPSNRCYFCRSTEADALRRFGLAEGIARYVDGVHRDDLGEDRPGLRALDEQGFEHPLLWAGWGKARVRAEARALGLSAWDRPSNACLASRVPTGMPISAALLARVDAAETLLRARGYRRIRVRVDGDGARVEVGADEVPRLTATDEWAEVAAALRAEGFATVRADARGYPLRANA